MYCFVQKALFFTAASQLFPPKAREVSHGEKISCHPEDMCTDIKQNKNVFLKIFIFRKNKGGERSKSPKSLIFLPRQTFLPEKSDEKFQNRPEKCFMLN